MRFSLIWVRAEAISTLDYLAHFQLQLTEENLRGLDVSLNNIEDWGDFKDKSANEVSEWLVNEDELKALLKLNLIYEDIAATLGKQNGKGDFIKSPLFVKLTSECKTAHELFLRNNERYGVEMTW